MMMKGLNVQICTIRKVKGLLDRSERDRKKIFVVKAFVGEPAGHMKELKKIPVALKQNA